MMEPWSCSEICTQEESQRLFDQSQIAAQEALKGIYAELKARHLANIQQEEEKGEYSYRVRTKLLAEMGLQEVREFRTKQLDHERTSWRAQIAAQRDILPELNPLLVVIVG